MATDIAENQTILRETMSNPRNYSLLVPRRKKLPAYLPCQYIRELSYQVPCELFPSGPQSEGPSFPKDRVSRDQTLACHSALVPRTRDRRDTRDIVLLRRLRRFRFHT